MFYYSDLYYFVFNALCNYKVPLDVQVIRERHCAHARIVSITQKVRKIFLATQSARSPSKNVYALEWSRRIKRFAVLGSNFLEYIFYWKRLHVKT